MTSEEAAAAAVAPVLLEKWTKITLDVPLLVDVITDRQTDVPRTFIIHRRRFHVV